MDFKELRYVVEVAKYSSVSKAANSLGISQPSLSKFIKNLENQLGVKLFKYVNRKFELTYAGELYLSSAKKILKLAEGFDTDMLEQDEESEPKNLHIYLPIHMSSTILFNIIPQFKNKFPNATLTLLEFPSNQIERMLISGDVNIVITDFKPKSNKIEYEHIINEEILLVIPRHHPMANEGLWRRGADRPWIDIKKFMYDSFLMPSSDQIIRIEVDKLFSREGIVPKVIMVTRDIGTSVRLAASGTGVTFAPESCINPALLSQVPACFSVGDSKLEMAIGVAYRKGYEMSNEELYFIKLIKKLTT